MLIFHMRSASESVRLCHVRLLETPWTVARQAPLSMGFSRQEHWSGGAMSFSRDLANPGIKPGSPALQADSLPSEPPGKPHFICIIYYTIYDTPVIHIQTIYVWYIYISPGKYCYYTGEETAAQRSLAICPRCNSLRTVGPGAQPGC